MGCPLKSLTIQGFKSIKLLDNFVLNDLNILIGANGAGKSNFVTFFRLLREMADEGLRKYINQNGGADSFFFLGPKYTDKIKAHLTFGVNDYQFTLEPTADSELIIEKEWVRYIGGESPSPWSLIGSGAYESSLKKRKERTSDWGPWKGVEHYVYGSVSDWVVYHFHDTSMLAPMRRDQSVRDKSIFRHDASNIAPFLLNLREKHEDSYYLIRDTVKLIAPFFDDFYLNPEEKGEEEKVRLEWNQKGSNYPFQAGQLSDGTIRFICLATALLQPTPPATILIDEPELGLHPYAISVLANLIQSAASRTQLIISTQSPTLLDCFEAEDIITVNRSQSGSTFNRLNTEDLTEWLEEYSVGELWQKNVVRGGPTHE